MWTKAQVMKHLAQQQATYVREVKGVKWYRMPDRSFLAVRDLPNGWAQVQQLPASSCGCGS